MRKTNLTTEQAADQLCCTTAWIRKLAGAGRIPGAIKFNSDWSIPPTALRKIRYKKRGRKKLSKSA
jgi:hypothetical protein